MNRRILEEHLVQLSYHYNVDANESLSEIFVRDFQTPPGYNLDFIDARLQLPRDYPQSAPGQRPNSHLYLPAGLRFHGKKPKDFHSGWVNGDMAWWCFERIDWDPCRDNLVIFFEIVRMTLTYPQV